MGAEIISETLKTEQERHKTTQKALDLVDQAGSFLGKIFEPAAHEFGLMLGERMRFWRFKNFVNILGQAQRITDERGLSPEQLKVLPFGHAIRTIETASFEEEDSVQNLWARLIANAVDPESNVEITKFRVEILKSLSPAEAALMDLLWECEKKSSFKSADEIKEFNQTMNDLAEKRWRKFSHMQMKAAKQNLIRLRCIAFRPRSLNASFLFAQLPREINIRTSGKWAVVDHQKLQRVLEQLADLAFVAAGIKDHSEARSIPLGSGPFLQGSLDIPEMNFLLTSLGSDLMYACRSNGREKKAHTGQDR